MAVGRRPGPVHPAIAASSSSAARTAACASAGSGESVTLPRVPSIRTGVPAGTSSSPLTATTQGMPSWRAMIAVWLVGPPRVVARPTTSVGSRPAVSAGARSSAHRIEGSAGTGTPGSGRPLSSATTRSRMSRRSVTRSAIRPPTWVNRSTNWSTASPVARTAGLPSAIRFSAAPSQARSWASMAVAASTSEATPVAAAARSRSRSATAAAAAVKRAASASPVGLGDLATRVEIVQRGQPTGADHGGEPDARTTGTPVRTAPAAFGSEVGAEDAGM